MHRRLLLLVFCFLLLVIPSAAAKRAFTIEDLYRVRGLEDLHVSPDGKSVLFTMQHSDLAKGKEHQACLADGRRRQERAPVYVWRKG